MFLVYSCMFGCCNCGGGLSFFVHRSTLDNARVLQELQDQGLPATVAFLRQADPSASVSCLDSHLKRTALRLKTTFRKLQKSSYRDPESLQTFLSSSFVYPKGNRDSSDSSYFVFPDAAVMTRSQDPEEGCSSKCGHELAAKSLASDLRKTLEAKEEGDFELERNIRIDIQTEVCFSHSFIHLLNFSLKGEECPGQKVS